MLKKSFPDLLRTKATLVAGFLKCFVTADVFLWRSAFALLMLHTAPKLDCSKAFQHTLRKAIL